MANVESRRRARLLRRMQALRRALKQLDADQDVIEARLSTARDKIVEHTAQIDDHETRIVALENP